MWWKMQCLWRCWYFPLPLVLFNNLFSKCFADEYPKDCMVWLDLYSKYVTTRRNKIYRIKNPFLTCKNHEDARSWLTSSPSCILLPTRMQRRYSERLVLQEPGRWNEQLATASSLEFISPFKARKYIKDRGHRSVYMGKAAAASGL